MLAALRPPGLRERVRLAMGGGYTALQVWDRLSPAARAALAPGGADPTVAARHAVERVQRVLMTLAASGRARHRRAGMSVVLNTKGPRDVLVDVFRAT
ncbi:MAG: hypothetical protein V4850_03895 [Myxococcota bacterium]